MAVFAGGLSRQQQTAIEYLKAKAQKHHQTYHWREESGQVGAKSGKLKSPFTYDD